jgi:hypothetical protein
MLDKLMMFSAGLFGLALGVVFCYGIALLTLEFLRLTA